jgi:hypothetical protein
MQSTCSPRFTIRQLMIVIAVAACLLGLSRMVTAGEPDLAACLAAVPTVLVLLHLVIEQIFGAPCPVCSRWALRRLARHRRHYRCTECRARVKRFWFGPWLDASGPEDAARYRKPQGAGTWTEFAVSEHLDDSTSGQLLKNKRFGHPPDHKARRPVYKPEPSPRLEEARAKVRDFFERLNQIKK